ncbi:hypothetical protein ACIBK8_35140 [Streptomyces sp. NPDC050161]|uniref:hypothetical protein n=1 Tax=Streptomyces sp. NPDC050161 TaxID=3365604 RepID=UPI0037A2C568
MPKPASYGSITIGETTIGPQEQDDSPDCRVELYEMGGATFAALRTWVGQALGSAWVLPDFLDGGFDEFSLTVTSVFEAQATVRGFEAVVAFKKPIPQTPFTLQELLINRETDGSGSFSVAALLAASPEHDMTFRGELAKAPGGWSLSAEALAPEGIPFTELAKTFTAD